MAPTNKKFYLFGYPVAHSASPAFHNCVFQGQKTGNSFEYWSTSKVTDEMLETLQSDKCGGTAVTMPLKAAIIPFLDEISPESRITDACNTIVKVPTANGQIKLVGQNTDILGVRNALVNALSTQFPARNISPNLSFSVSAKGAGLVIGGGATTRSAAHALTLLGLSPIFLINRDPAEVKFVQDAMPHLSSKNGLIHLRTPQDVEDYLVGEGKPQILMAVGAIPAISPQTYAERMVYTTVMALLTIPYAAPYFPESELPIPVKRLFLEMPYKPLRTPMLQIVEAMGWHGLNGIQAMIEQGLAQQRMWHTGQATVEAGSDGSILPPDIEAAARELAGGMTDVVVHDKEMDRAEGKEAVKRK